MKNALADRKWDKKLRIATAGMDASEAGAHRARYEPTPYAVLERLAAGGWIDAESRVLDYGCGKGRVVIYLAAQLGCWATGIDFSAKLIGIAEKNRRSGPAAERTAFVRCPAEQYELRDEDAFFFFNPFSEKVLRIVLQRIFTSWYDAPRRMRLFFYYPSRDFISCLMAEPRLSFAAEIDCRDLFWGNDPREKILVFEVGEGRAD